MEISRLGVTKENSFKVTRLFLVAKREVDAPRERAGWGHPFVLRLSGTIGAMGVVKAREFQVIYGDRPVAWL
ncbi:MAG: hypothetical protein CMJ96_07585 [Planctomycetes bacterium]|nr:hypothetical protein [Planctomycetota bacterium]